MKSSLGLERWNFKTKTPDSRRMVKVEIITKYPNYDDLTPFKPAERCEIIKGRRRKSYERLIKSLGDDYDYTIIKRWKNRPIGVNFETTLADLKKLSKRRMDSDIFIQQIQGAKKIRERKIDSFFCVKAIFQIQIEGKKKGMQNYEERYILVKSKNGESAEKKLLKSFKSYEKPYLNSNGEFVRWKFESFEDCYSTDIEKSSEIDVAEGAEVFSKLRTRKLRVGNVWTLKKK